MFPKFLKNKYVLILAAIMLIGAGGFFWYYGYAPVLSVDGKSVSMGEFLKIQSAITQFDNLSHRNSTTTAAVEINKQALGNLIDRLLLDKIIMEIDSTILQKAKDNVSEAISKNQEFSLAEASRKLYGLTEEEFIELVLLPQAKRNLLAERFKDDPDKINGMWDESAKAANIKIYYPGFYWENGQVMEK